MSFIKASIKGLDYCSSGLLLFSFLFLAIRTSRFARFAMALATTDSHRAAKIKLLLICVHASGGGIGRG